MPNNASVTPGSDARRPLFVPWDRKAFLERLQTFQDVGKWLWVQKPDPINDAPWAKRGWTAIAHDTVGCASCSAEVTIVLAEPEPEEGPKETEMSEAELRGWQEAAMEQLVQKYEEMIVTGHKEGCPWREKGCDGKRYSYVLGYVILNAIGTATIHRLPLAHSSTALDALRLRYDSLVKIASDLPPKLEPPEGFDIDKLSTQFSALVRMPKKNSAANYGGPSPSPKALTFLTEGSPSTMPRTPTTPSKSTGVLLAESQTPSGDSQTLSTEGQNSQAYQGVNKKALTLAIFGWQAEKDHPSNIQGIASCKTCFRRNLLSSYRERADGTIPYYPEDHRGYCPWTNASTQNGGRVSGDSASEQDLAGWSTLVKLIDMAYASKTRRAKDTFTPPTVVIEAMRPASRGVSHDAEVVDEGVSVTEMDGAQDDIENQKKDKDLRARFKKLKRAFTIKRSKSTGKDNSDAKRTKSIA